ncbi:MAG: BtpA/SgcQ family protein [Verrucomicrobiota bacterium]
MSKKTLIAKNRRILIGVIHLLPLPGSPRWAGEMDKIVRSAVADARAYEEGGADTLIIENFGDIPFTKSAVPPETVAAMAVAGAAVRSAVGLPIGFNVLRNDGHSALALCAACGGDFIRVNVLSGAMVTDQGVIEGEAFSLLRKQRELAPHVKILADVLVKHAAPLGDLTIEIAARDTAERGLADALLVSGTGTGVATEIDDVRRVRAACPVATILLGSGVTPSNAASYLEFADGLIVGTSTKRGGDISKPVDVKRVAALRAAMN